MDLNLFTRNETSLGMYMNFVCVLGVICWLVVLMTLDWTLSWVGKYDNKRIMLSSKAKGWAPTSSLFSIEYPFRAS